MLVYSAGFSSSTLSILLCSSGLTTRLSSTGALGLPAERLLTSRHASFFPSYLSSPRRFVPLAWVRRFLLTSPLWRPGPLRHILPAIPCLLTCTRMPTRPILHDILVVCAGPRELTSSTLSQLACPGRHLLEPCYRVLSAASTTTEDASSLLQTICMRLLKALSQRHHLTSKIPSVSPLRLRLRLPQRPNLKVCWSVS